VPVKIHSFLKPALRLMTPYRLEIEEIKDSQAITSYTRWVDAVQVNGTENKEVYLTFSPRFEHIWLESKKRLLESAARKPPPIGLRNRYAIRLYAWAKEHRLAGSKRITLERLRTVLGLDSVKDPKGKVIRKAPLSSLHFAAIFAYYQQNPAEVDRLASDLIELATRHNFAFWLALGGIWRGWARRRLR
jgi:hypothetical protein